MQIDDRACMAARNNASLYEAMFSSHGVQYVRLPFAFVGKERPPPFHSDLTVLAPNHIAAVEREIAAIVARTGGPLGVKDSFCQLNLDRTGLRVLFSSSWVWKDVGASASLADWQIVDTQADLKLWEEAWKADGSSTPHPMFNAKMMERPGVYFFGRKTGERFEAGCIANVSEDCIGLSNMFSVTPSDDVFAQAAAAVASVNPSLPIVGYEAEEALQHALAAGFVNVGELRILVAK